MMRLVAKYERQRKRLDFVPNTLGVTLADFTHSVRLLEGLAEEDGALFKREQVTFDQAATEDDTASPAYRDLLSDLDRVFSDFEKTAKAHAWLGDGSLGGGEHLLREAASARQEGARVSGIDLLEFVVDAVRSDSAIANAAAEVAPGLWRLHLPPSWTYGLEDLPGWDAEARVLTLTTDLARTIDETGRAVGYIGRAHPVVRRALDRVQSLQFGSGVELLDRRVAAAQGTGDAPEVLFTFLGRVQSAAGRELERVIAVRWARGSEPQSAGGVAEWLGLAAPDRAVSARDAWKRHFAEWVDMSAPRVAEIAARAFEPFASDLMREHRQTLDEERRDLETWLAARADDLCGAPIRQTELFGASGVPAWQRPLPEVERLAAFATDRGNAPRARSEAALVISVYERRKSILDARSTLAEPSTSLLGLLLLVPAGSTEATP